MTPCSEVLMLFMLPGQVTLHVNNLHHSLVDQWLWFPQWMISQGMWFLSLLIGNCLEPNRLWGSVPGSIPSTCARSVFGC
eukprot:283191-Amphidinium_carterae.2